MAPELYINKESKPITSDFSKIDMWALGIILYQLVASNNHPFEKEDDKNNLFALINNI